MKTTLTFLLFTGLALSQTPAPVKSPEVQADGRVTFRLRSPNAKEVFVSLEGTAHHFAMQKDSQGIWSYTTEPLTPDNYGYSFEVDGVHFLDPSNHLFKPNLLSLSNVVDVPSKSPLPWDMTDVPHGTVHQHFYKSNVVGDNRAFFVYTPPGYDPTASKLYPVLYLLHGYSDDASGWTAVGQANLILDNLIAQGKAKSMIVVMPLGYGAPEIVQPGSRAFSDPTLRDRNFSRFKEALLTEVIPSVQKLYRASTDREQRAIAGLSMGGAESLLTGLNNLDTFAWVGSFSAGGFTDQYATEFPNLTGDAVNKQLHLLWIACGTEDRLITPNRKFIEWLKSKDVHLTQIETPGMHTWMVWRRNLSTFAPLLFTSGQ